MLKLFKSTKNQKNVLVTEVGSGSIFIYIIETTSSNELGRVIWSHRETLPFKTEVEFDSKKLVLNALMRAVLTINTEGIPVLYATSGNGIINEVQVIFTAPWSYTASETIILSEKEDFQVTADFFENLTTTATKKIIERQLDYSVKTGRKLELLNRIDPRVTINGYTTSNPINKSGREISVTSTTTFIDTDILQKTTEVIEKALNNSSVSFYTNNFRLLELIRCTQPHKIEFSLLDITYEATELLIIKDNEPNQSKSISVGKNTLARNIAKIHNAPHEHISSLLSSDNEILKFQSKDEEKATLSIIKQYQDVLKELFSSSGLSLVIPKTLFVNGDIHPNSIILKSIKHTMQELTGDTSLIYHLPTELLKKQTKSTVKLSADRASVIGNSFIQNQQF